MPPPSILGPVRGVFRSVARTVAPAAQRLDGAAWAEVEATVERALGKRPAGTRKQVVLFLRLLDLLAYLRFGRRLASVPPDRALAFLKGLERAPVLAVRRGMWGVRTLAFMGVYTRETAQAELGYRGAPSGWASRDGQGAWPERGKSGAPEEGILVVSHPKEEPRA